MQKFIEQFDLEEKDTGLMESLFESLPEEVREKVPIMPRVEITQAVKKIEGSFFELLEELEDQLHINKELESERDSKANYQAEVQKAVNKTWLLLDLEQIFQLFIIVTPSRIQNHQKCLSSEQWQLLRLLRSASHPSFV